MNDKNVIIPMLIGVISQAVVAIIAALCTAGQSVVCKLFMHMDTDIKVIPTSLLRVLFVLVMFILFFLIVKTYGGESKRVVAIIMTAVYCFFSIAGPYATVFLTSLSAVKGAEYMAVTNSLNSAINLFSAPFSVIAYVLIIIGIARYGIQDNA